ncbi:class I SAM-dependent methyltransferase [Noviherbaspirillum cavernae]|uniref:Class I SAM-dependent methyltransferase n=1 Tax=Noviherbaspirillum cavernae TaxID=2320862 RepID=A0A418X0D4_9BURK|nr:class I SAM-dependent methyltransferase [Noviherbaspirillum cavernae]RJG05911.1 class I SAM-dependent methyltransferase [Noviherbaspirillum cavernae]
MNGVRSGTGVSHDSSLLNKPAVQAALIQAASFAVVVAIAYALPLLSAAPLTIVGAALLQGAFAALISRLLKLAPWWLPIQAVFPIALVAMLSVRLPPEIFLVAFVALLGLYWTTFRTQVPFYPSGPKTWDAVLDILPADRPIRFIDVGSGLGGLVLRLAEARTDSVFVGIELAPLPWLASLLRKWIRRSAAHFTRGDYGRLDFAAYDVVFAYLSPAAMPALWQKAHAEMRTGTLLLSYEFDVPASEPHFVHVPVDGGPALYGWHM